MHKYKSFQRVSRAMLTMNPIFHSVFEACHKIIDYSPFLDGCEFDMCHVDVKYIGCSSVQSYADTCAKAGVCIDWRNATNGVCGKQLECLMFKCTSQINLITAMTLHSLFIFP